MTTPNSSSFSNLNSPVSPRPAQAPPSNSQNHITTGPTIQPMPSPTNTGPDSNWTTANTLTTAGATATTSISGAALYLQGRQYSSTQKKVITDIYDRCRCEESFTIQDAFFHLRENDFADEDVFRVLTAADRIPKVGEGFENFITPVNGQQTVQQRPVSVIVEEAAPAGAPSSGPYVMNQEINFNAINLTENGKPSQVFENGQILIVDDNSYESMKKNQGNDGMFCSVRANLADPPGLLDPGYPQHYKNFVVLFFGLFSLFGLLLVNYIKLQNEQDKFNYDQNRRFSSRPMKIDNKLIEILSKFHQKETNLAETRRLLETQCSLSKNSIDELLLNF